MQDQPTLTISVNRFLGLVSLAGELDREQSPQLLVALSTLARTSHQAWLIDAADVTFCDAGGLRALAAAATAARDHGCRLQITGASRCVQRLIALAELGELLRPPTPAQLPYRLPGSRHLVPAPHGGLAQGRAAPTGASPEALRPWWSLPTTA